MPFTALGLDPRIVQAVQEAGYTEPTPIQAAAIPVIITGQDVTGIAQTGTGKTAAFTLPLLTRMASAADPANGRRRTRALVLAPTRELAVQIEENVRTYAKHLPLTMATVFGGVGERPQINALRAGTDLIIACPGRLLDLLGQGHGDFSGIETLILDEADRMLDMGFLPSIRRIIRGLPKQRQTLLFSATLSKEIETLTTEFQHAPKTIQIGRRSNPAETVAQWVYEIPAHLKPNLLGHLLEDPAMNSVLVFTRTKHGADRIARRLEALQIPCGTLHSNRSQNQRLKALKDFRSGLVRVLVATDIAARGIDVDGISHVVNYDFPPHAEDYVHRIGRTGRAQAIGDAISFVSSEDTGALRDLERFIGRGILRKKAEGFDLSAPAPPRPAGPPPGRGGNQSQGGQRPPQRRPQGGGGPSGGGEGRSPNAPGGGGGRGRGESRAPVSAHDPSVYPRHQDPRRRQQQQRRAAGPQA
ncbi:MAG: putative ATP-dependent helicase RhlE [Verrucomicrobiales bacterium]|nr:putative ATP-dependent helicase RhlE [Verrucomicrobiales bacterium]